jgi:hypothetical protein
MHVNNLINRLEKKSALTGAPIYARHILIPTVLKKVLLPDMLDPVIIEIEPMESML